MSLIFSWDLISKMCWDLMCGIFKKKASASKGNELVLYTGADNTSQKVKDKKAVKEEKEDTKCFTTGISGMKTFNKFQFLFFSFI